MHTLGVGIIIALLLAQPLAAGAVVDTTSTAAAERLAPPPTRIVFARSVFDSIYQNDYLLRHSFSLDHFMESQVGFVLGRSGPIGKRTGLSRHGFGRGRTVVYLDGIPINDPQNDIAPIVHFPVSEIGMILVGSNADGFTPAADGIEGRVAIISKEPPTNRPRTFFELSKGGNDLRQRRVRFSSASSVIGIDLNYDELLNDGYAFDARRLTSNSFVGGRDYGRSRSRYYGMRLRGVIDNDFKYGASFRKFTSSSDGDLASATSSQRLSGHLAAASVSFGQLHFRLFERGYNATYPDSSTTNQTTAAYMNWQGQKRRWFRVSMGTGFEDIIAIQKVGGGEARPRLRKSTARVAVIADLDAGVTGRVQISGADYHGMATGWGGLAELAKPFGAHEAAIEFRRGYRMPNLGELFSPLHSVRSGGGLTMSGNKYLKSERTWEAGGRLGLKFGPVTNEIRWTALRVEDAIVFEQTGPSGPWVAANAHSEQLGVLENRIRAAGVRRGFEIDFAAGVSRTAGDRDAFFYTVPKTSINAGARIGRNLFEKTSALYLGVDYAYRSARRGRTGALMPTYHVFNFKLEGRLLDANMYLLLLNAFDETYQTENGFLMTPRTFVYGLAWTLFE